MNRCKYIFNIPFKKERTAHKATTQSKQLPDPLSVREPRVERHSPGDTGLKNDKPSPLILCVAPFDTTQSVQPTSIPLPHPNQPHWTVCLLWSPESHFKDLLSHNGHPEPTETPWCPLVSLLRNAAILKAPCAFYWRGASERGSETRIQEVEHFRLYMYSPEGYPQLGFFCEYWWFAVKKYHKRHSCFRAWRLTLTHCNG